MVRARSPASYIHYFRKFQAGTDFKPATSMDFGGLILSYKTVEALNWPLTSIYYQDSE
jgi:hypothetical protein